eukprot:COSAG02_NODE_34281_length_486_cov_1.105943_1_plen_162_part_11
MGSSNQLAAAAHLFMVLLLLVHAGAVAGQLPTPCTTNSDCDYPGCNSEGIAYPSLAVACLADGPLSSPYCQHDDSYGGHHICAERPSGWVAPGSDSAACLCPALGYGMACTSDVRQVADFAPLQDALGQCVDFLIDAETVAEDDVLALHCPDECPTETPPPP